MISKVLQKKEYHILIKDGNKKYLRGKLSAQLTATIPNRKFVIEIEDESKPAFTVGGFF